MATLIENPNEVPSGSDKKEIWEYFGKVATEQEDISIAEMFANIGWQEPGQIAEFTEYIYVISGRILIETKNENFIVAAGRSIAINKGEWVRFSTPFSGANYIAICIPAFQPTLVKRDEQ